MNDKNKGRMKIEEVEYVCRNKKNKPPRIFPRGCNNYYFCSVFSVLVVVFVPSIGFSAVGSEYSSAGFSYFVSCAGSAVSVFVSIAGASSNSFAALICELISPHIASLKWSSSA